MIRLLRLLSQHTLRIPRGTNSRIDRRREIVSMPAEGWGVVRVYPREVERRSKQATNEDARRKDIRHLRPDDNSGSNLNSGIWPQSTHPITVWLPIPMPRSLFFPSVLSPADTEDRQGDYCVLNNRKYGRDQLQIRRRQRFAGAIAAASLDVVTAILNESPR